MKLKIFVAIACFLSVIFLIVLVEPARTYSVADADFVIQNRANTDFSVTSSYLNQFAPKPGCVLKPSANPPDPSLPAALTSTPISLARFRQEPRIASSTAKTPATEVSTRASKVSATSLTASKKTNDAPKETIALADPSNYGDRYLKDLAGRTLDNAPLIVLHETVGSTSSVIDFFQTFHSDENDQASYHTMISQDGTIVYFVPPDKRAFGAGESVFRGARGEETVQTNPRFSSSVNNFAYHISLETPWDGMHDGETHSGYTSAQYRSLAWLVAKTSVAPDRITTHRAVDRSGTRIDPRSFDFQAFQKLLSKYPKTKEIAIGCG
ncbi:peptidoglycan recognition family protein [Tumidithrix elongata RA019]|uniref:N-acetylmuramoyl-L-alanine amidase n=1 Tax=Tumidithrix elongata BACA0141 TaxID=2716417 RepID=A0AAW9PU42_9CYAN|nr:peptidoglycan recognition family protein [Tumidithrix elongata RA019]